MSGRTNVAAAKEAGCRSADARAMRKRLAKLGLLGLNAAKPTTGRQAPKATDPRQLGLLP